MPCAAAPGPDHKARTTDPETIAARLPVIQRRWAGSHRVQTRVDRSRLRGAESPSQALTTPCRGYVQYPITFSAHSAPSWPLSLRNPPPALLPSSPPFPGIEKGRRTSSWHPLGAEKNSAGVHSPLTLPRWSSPQNVFVIEAGSIEGGLSGIRARMAAMGEASSRWPWGDTDSGLLTAHSLSLPLCLPLSLSPSIFLISQGMEGRRRMILPKYVLMVAMTR